MEKIERDFKGIWIPASLWLDPELSAIEVVLLAEIDSLDKGQGCFASNEYLSKFLRGRVSPGRIANMITDLRKKGYLIDRSFDGRCRYISLHENVKAAFTNLGGQPSQICEHSNTVSIKDKKKVTSNGKTDCSLPPQTIKFNYTSNKLIIPDREILSGWRRRYPDVDVPAELRLIEDWCIANPQKVKPRQRDGTGGLYRTITNWLRREQEKYEATLRIQKARQRVEEGEYNDECAND